MVQRVLIVNSTFYPNVVGGAEMSSWLLARELTGRGVHVDALASTGFLDEGSHDTLDVRELEGIDGEILEAASCGHQHLLAREGEPRPGLVRRGRHHYAQIHDRRWRKLAREALERTKPDLVHTNTIVGMTAAVWEAARERGIPVLHTLRDYQLLCPRTTLQRSSGAQCEGGPLPCQILRALKRRHLDGVHAATAPSRFVLDRHAAYGFFDDIRREVVPNACETLPPAYREPPAGSVAGHGPLQYQVEAFCAHHEGRVRFHGMVQGEEKRDLLRDCAFVTVPSVWHDNFPRTMLDAYMFGRPVIGARRGGIPEVVRDGETGTIIEPDARSLASAIARYAADEPLRLLHGQAARRLADRYTLDHQVDLFQGLYEDLAGA